MVKLFLLLMFLALPVHAAAPVESITWTWDHPIDRQDGSPYDAPAMNEGYYININGGSLLKADGSAWTTTPDATAFTADFPNGEYCLKAATLARDPVEADKNERWSGWSEIKCKYSFAPIVHAAPNPPSNVN